jgi:hypothetical protein
MSLLQYVLSFTTQTGFYLENPEDALTAPRAARSNVYTTPSASRTHLKRLRDDVDLHKVPDPLIAEGFSNRAHGWEGNARSKTIGDVAAAADGAGSVAPVLNWKECILVVLRNFGRALSATEITDLIARSEDLLLQVNLLLAQPQQRSPAVFKTHRQ